MNYLFAILLVSITYSAYSMMKAIRTKSAMAGGAGITLLPKSEVYSKVFFFFHGLGDTADGWASMMPSLSLADTKIILPTAQTRPISLNMGSTMPGWSDIYGLDADDHEDKAGFDESASRIQALIEAEHGNGISYSNIVVGGFSQGGALALHVALRSQHKLGGCVALSTWLPLHKEYPAAITDAAKTLPILQMHGDEDRVVGFAWGQKSHHLLKSMISFPAPKFIKIEGMGHSSSEEEMSEVSSFIKSIFEDTSASSSS